MHALESWDAQLVRIVDAATARAQAVSGHWLACHPGCTQCCHGVFSISQMDAIRLRRGLDELAGTDPMRASAVIDRARQAVSRLSPEFPGDPATGILAESDPAFEDRFDAFANDDPCPALDPESGLCDLYSARPIACRTFGPPLETRGGFAVCELCFVGATPEEVARCAVSLDEAGALEEKLTAAAEQLSARTGSTLVAFALARELPRSSPDLSSGLQPPPESE